MYYKALLNLVICFLIISNTEAQPSREDIEKARDLFNKGVQHGVNEDYEKALEAFNNAIKINPVYAKAFLYRGLTKTELPDYKDAIKDFTITIELDPGYSDQAHYFRGLTKHHLGNYNASIQDMSVAIRLNPDFISFFQRGKSYLRLEEYGRALQDFEISYRLNPDFEKIHLYRGKSLYYIEQTELAIKDLETAKKLLPDNPEVFYYSGLARIDIQNSYAAIQDLDKCIELNPDFHKAYEARAQARKNTGNHNAAQADLEKAKSIIDEGETTAETTIQPTKKEREDPEKKTTPHEINIADYFVTNEHATKSEISAFSEMEEEVDSEKKSKHKPKNDTEVTPDSTSEAVKKDITLLSTGLYNNMLNKVNPKGFGIQVASYSSTNNLQNLAGAYEEQFKKPVYININKVNEQKVYRIIIGEFNEREKAESFRDNLRENHFSDSFLIVFERLY